MARLLRGSGEEVAGLLDKAAAAFEEARLADVIALARKALHKAPEHPEALHFLAAAQLESGDLQAAERTYRRALMAAPDDPDILLGAADLFLSHPGEDLCLVEEGLALCERGRKLAAKEGDGELELELLLLLGVGHNQLGECEKALEHLDAALALQPDSVEAHLERGITLFELCCFDASREALLRVADQAPEEAWAHHYLGLLAERSGEAREAKKRFLRAQELSPQEFVPPVRLSDEEFDRALEDAVARLPQHVKKYLENTTLAVEPFPSREDLTSQKPPLSPSILGIFRGTPVGERSVSSAYDHFPAAIVLYQRNLERFARSRDELIEQIGITVMHEVGHLIGLDEEDLWERGLD
ncbi:MAG: metallopeptidase family protein [Myxococcota bacterium]